MRLTRFVFRAVTLLAFAAIIARPDAAAIAAALEVFHADSLSGPMRGLKSAFEAAHPGVTLHLTAGVSRELADRILKGDVCDVFAPSSPAVIDDLMKRKVAGSERDAAAWYVVFSANEMVVITAKGNPLGIRKIADLARPDARFVRVTGEKDLATNRTVEFVKRAATLEGTPDLATAIIDRAAADPAKPTGIPDVVNAVRDGRANAAIVYYSAAVAAGNDVDVVRFPDTVNLSEAIRNAATVPGTATSPKDALEFVRFVLSPEARRILQEAGQPPVVPPLRSRAVPAELK